MNILVIQTAFAGDLVLTTPMIAELARLYPAAAIDVLCIPSTAGLLENQPAIREAVVYNKRGGVSESVRVVRRIRKAGYDMAVSPHRSFRSALMAWLSGAARRIAFDTATGSMFYTDTVQYDGNRHEVERNLALLAPLGADFYPNISARLYPSADDETVVQNELRRRGAGDYVCIAPGSVWPTKRWTEGGFIKTAEALAADRWVVLAGGPDDRALCERIEAAVNSARCFSLAGKLRWLETAVLVRDADVVISNDSAPVHVASAMDTPVVEIYGATAPEFGFTPWQVPHEIVQRGELPCKPCAIHGGTDCPIGTFECMRGLPAEWVVEAARRLIDRQV